MNDLITIGNNGREISDTNYFDTEHAAQGFFFASTNAGAVRLLVPDSQIAVITEFKTAEYVILSRGPWPDLGFRRPEGIELLFEDYSDNPFALHMPPEQFDMLPDGIGEWVFAVWTRNGKQFECPLKYRKVDRIPYMKEWIVKRVFPLRVVLSVTTKHLLTEPENDKDNGIGDIVELISYMVGMKLFDSQLPSFAEKCRTALLSQYPDLAYVDDKVINSIKAVNPENWIKVLLDKCTSEFGLKAEYEVDKI